MEKSDKSNKRKKSGVENLSSDVENCDFSKLTLDQKLEKMFCAIFTLKNGSVKTNVDIHQVLAQQMELKKEFDQLNSRVKRMVFENNRLKKEIILLKQKKFEATISIGGLSCETFPEGSELQLVQRISEFFGVPVTTADIKGLRRYKPQENGKQASIIVDFWLKNTKEQILKARRGKSIFTTDLEITGKKQQIYLNEYLIKESYGILKYARKLKTNAAYRFVWYAGGKVWAKKQEGEKAVHIDSEESVDVIIDNM